MKIYTIEGANIDDVTIVTTVANVIAATKPRQVVVEVTGITGTLRKYDLSTKIVGEVYKNLAYDLFCEKEENHRIVSEVSFYAEDDVSLEIEIITRRRR